MNEIFKTLCSILLTFFTLIFVLLLCNIPKLGIADPQEFGIAESQEELTDLIGVITEVKYFKADHRWAKPYYRPRVIWMHCSGKIQTENGEIRFDVEAAVPLSPHAILCDLIGMAAGAFVPEVHLRGNIVGEKLRVTMAYITDGINPSQQQTGPSAIPSATAGGTYKVDLEDMKVKFFITYNKEIGGYLACTALAIDGNGGKAWVNVYPIQSFGNFYNANDYFGANIEETFVDLDIRTRDRIIMAGSSRCRALARAFLDGSNISIFGKVLNQGTLYKPGSLNAETITITKPGAMLNIIYPLIELTP